MAAAVGLTARGQDRPTADPKYYQGRASQTDPGTYPGTTVRPGGQQAAPLTYPGVATYPGLPPLPGGASRPRLTQPVMAGPDGVRQMSTGEPVSAMPPVVPPPSDPPPPRVNVEKPGDPNLPDPKPLPTGGEPPAGDPLPAPPALPGGSPVILPPPSTPTVPTTPPQPSKPTAPTPAAPSPAAEPVRPVFQEQSAAQQPSVAPLPSRTAPSLTVDAVAPETVGVGQAMTYELVVRNVGTSPAMTVRVEDELPAKAALVSSEPAAETSGDRLAWSLGTLDPGVERRIKVTVKPGDEGELHSRAVVTFASSVEARVRVTRPRIAVAMTGPEASRVGERVPFVIKLSNTGTGSAGRVLLRAQFSDGLAHPQGQVIEAELPALKAGETKTLSLEAVALKSGSQSCTLTAAADGNPGETAKASVTLVEPMLVAKQSGPSRCLVKGEPTYQIEMSNPGTASTDPLQLWASLPTGFEFVSATDGGAFVDANRAVGWRLPGLPPGTTRMVSLKLRATAPAEGVIRTVAMTAAAQDAVTPAGGVPTEARPGKGLEARAETPVKAEGVPALRFEVADLEDPVEVGKEAVYEIRVVNQGTGPCTGVQITADLAEGTTAAGATGPTTGRVTGQQITFDPIPTFGVKAEAVYKVRVKGSVAGDTRFRVRLSCDQIKTPVVKEENTRFYKE
jgi:uncharacterized repeat protein (TIGR01451 family)